ncbi:osteoclast-stimulating factor 1-like isoform X2 [Dermacentor andersoni]|uniref:osteoclast-stimulating factor 1-like isoform X2 n=1 Tax=Dermacentor andersoni TaxID=34620 RepID=UPI002415BCCB|nr:osteoclast-stimulating factor 1-like isoform X2 [Dermacentor andersoni]
MSSKPSRPAPPPPKPGSVKVFRALYKYHAQQPDELSFEEGDLLYVFDMMSDPNWWKARCDRRSGLIPSNYVEENAEEVLHPLHESAKRGNLQFLEECLSNKNKLGDTPLHSSAWKGHSDIVRMLLAAGANKNVKNKEGRTPLELASDPETVALLKSSQRTSISTDPEEYLQSDEDSN